MIAFLNQQMKQTKRDMGIMTPVEETLEQIKRYKAIKQLKEILVEELVEGEEAVLWGMD